MSKAKKKTKPAARRKTPAPRGVPKLRISFGEGRILGPGKVDLLEAIDRTGSISAAGRDMGMSYRRAWILVDELNRMFASPSVVASTGGSHGGGAALTEFGRSVAAAYRRAEQRTLIAVREELGPLDKGAK